MQLSFFASPSVLPTLEHNFRTDERVMRYLVVKAKPYEALPKAKQLRVLEQELREQLAGKK